jgi:hypothetical protein
VVIYYPGWLLGIFFILTVSLLESMNTTIRKINGSRSWSNYQIH